MCSATSSASPSGSSPPRRHVGAAGVGRDREAGRAPGRRARSSPRARPPCPRGARGRRRSPRRRRRRSASARNLHSAGGRPHSCHGRRRAARTANPGSTSSCSSLPGRGGRGICYVGTASAHLPECVELFYEAFRGRACEPSHLELFGMPEEPGGARRTAGRDLRRRRQHGEHARDLARARRRPRAARRVGARRRPRRHERRRELLVRGLGHRLLRARRLRPLGGGLGLLSGSFCPHYDGEPERRPTFTRLVADGHASARLRGRRRRRLSASRDTSLREVVSQREGAHGYRVTHGRRGAARRAAPVRKVAIVASASGNGKTTLGRELARRLDVPFVEMDALVHGPNWVETPDDELRAQVEPLVAADGWVIDGTYRSKLGDLVLDHADLVVWLDLPIRVWLPRLTAPHVAADPRARAALERQHARRRRARSGAASRSSSGPSGCTSTRRAAMPEQLAPYQSSACARRARSSAGSRASSQTSEPPEAARPCEPRGEAHERRPRPLPEPPASPRATSSSTTGGSRPSSCRISATGRSR